MIITAGLLTTIITQSGILITTTIITKGEVIPTKLLREVLAQALHPVHLLPRHQEAEAAAPRLERLEDKLTR